MRGNLGPTEGQLERVAALKRAKHADEEIVYTTCPNNGCFDMCVLKQHVKDGKVVAVETDSSVHAGAGREDAYCDPDDIRKGIYQRRACVRGRGMRSDAQSPTRILYPMRRVGPKPSMEFERISWDEALTTVAEKYLETREKYGPMSVWGEAMMGWTMEPYGTYFPGGALGGWGEDSYEPTNAADAFTYDCASSAPTFVTQGVDQGNAENQTFLDSDLIILWGFDAAVNYMETVYYLLLAKEKATPIITIDPRYTWTAEAIGTQHIFIRPGTDLAMMMAMCYVMFDEGIYDKDFAEKWIEPTGLEKWRAYVMGESDGAPKTPEWAEGICGVPKETIADLARLYASKDAVYIRMVWAAARMVYGKQVARGLNYLQALGGNIGKKGCAGNGTGYGMAPHVMQPMMFGALGTQPGPYGVNPCLEQTRWHEAILLRKEYDEGRMTEEEYRAEVGCPPGVEMPNIHMILELSNPRNLMAGYFDTARRREALLEVDFIAYCHWNMTNPTLPYCDIVMPISSPSMEGVANLGSSGESGPFFAALCGGCQNAFMYARGGQLGEGESQDSFWVMRKLGEKLGLGDVFMTALAGAEKEDLPEVMEGLAGKVYESWKAMPPPFGGAQCKPEPPSWEDFKENPIYMAEMDDYHVFLENNVKNDIPLTTPSGKIEFYCDWIADNDLTQAVHPIGSKCFGKGDLPPMAEYKHNPTGMLSPAAERFPLYMVTPHSFYRHHTAFDHSLWFRDEFRNSVWLSPSDAKARGVKDGDHVRVFNDVGEVVVPAYVTSRLTPGVCCIIFGRWYEPAEETSATMPDGIDTRGNCNFLIPSDLFDDVRGPLISNALVQIEASAALSPSSKKVEVR